MDCDYCGNDIASAKYKRYSGGNFDFVGETIPLPFICRRCGGTFCADHRLPEQHDCIGLAKNRVVVSLDDIIIKDDLEKQPTTTNKHVTPEEKMEIAKRMMARTKFAVEGYESNTNIEYINTRDHNYNEKKNKGKYQNKLKLFSKLKLIIKSKFSKFILQLLILSPIVLLLLYVANSGLPIQNSFAIDEAIGYTTTDVEIQFIKASGNIVYLADNTYAVNPTWDELIEFLKLDYTDRTLYEDQSFVCADFAEKLHNNAEKASIKSAFVSINFEDVNEGHALNAFNTTDKGLVYVDCTGSTTALDKLDSYDKIAYIEIGKEYGLVSIYYTKTPDYKFYDDRKNRNLRGFFESVGIVKDVDIFWNQDDFSTNLDIY